MSNLNIITAPISEDKLEYVKAFLSALKIQFSVSDVETYDDDFVKMIHKGDEDIKNGKGKTLDNIGDLWK
jgi:hypothetical protein